MLAIRITNGYKDLAKFFEWLVSKSTSLIVYEHNAKRIHVHALVEGCEVSTDTLKNHIKKVLNVETYPSTDWSFKTTYGKRKEKKEVDRNFITYMAKGKLNPVCIANYSMEEIEQYKNAWIEQGHVDDEDKPLKPTIWKLAQEIYDIHTTNHTRTIAGLTYYNGIDIEGCQRYQELLEIAIDVCNKYNQPYEENYLRRVVSTALGQNASGRKVLIAKMLRKEFPMY